MSHSGLTGIALPQLAQLLRLVQGGDLAVPLGRTALQARGLGAVWPELSWLAGLDRPALAAVLTTAIAERTTRPVPRLELVWTGPEAKVSTARDTAVVVRQLFACAQHTVLVAGFSFKGGHDIFESLHAAMRDRGVDARVFLHLDDRPGLPPEQSVMAGVEQFLLDNWPFGEPMPRMFYDPRTVAPGSSINLHAKCIVVDEQLAFVGSANFTHNAHVRNIEVGILAEDRSFASELSSQWYRLCHAGLVCEILHGKDNA